MIEKKEAACTLVQHLNRLKMPLEMR